MKLLSAIAFSVFITSVVLVASEKPKTDKSSAEDTTTVTHHPTTETPPTTSEPTTTHKSTTHKTSTVSTEPPTTTKSSTTEATTTSESPITTVKPTVAPQPSGAPIVSFNITEDGETCIRASMKLYFELSVNHKPEYIIVDKTAQSDGSKCKLSDGEESLVITVPGHYKFTMIFVNDSNVYVNETKLEYILPEVQGVASSDQKLFSVSAGHSYLCNSQTSVKLGNVTMHLSDVHIQAFGKSGNEDFALAQECDLDDKVSDAIPIAVGVALAALIIIVLIAYLVGRRQSRQRGYQSV